MKKILVARTDKIGDVVLATPVFEALKKINKDFFVAALVRNYTAPILLNNPYIDKIISFDETKRNFWWILKTIKQYKFQLIIVLYPNFKIGLVSLLSSIPQRVSTEAKIYNIFFYNKLIYQRRSRNLKNEASYNLEIVYSIFSHHQKEKILPKIWLTQEEKKKGYEILKSLGLSKEKYKVIFGIHPGYFGSSKAWHYKNYALLVDKLLLNPEFGVFVGYSEKETALVKNLLELTHKKPVLINNLSLREYICVIYHCDIFISNSTGPLHIAAALGKRTLGLFSPVSGLDIRWSPPHDNSYIIKPWGISCKRCKRNCNIDCMENIKVEEVLKKLKDML